MEAGRNGKQEHKTSQIDSKIFFLLQLINYDRIYSSALTEVDEKAPIALALVLWKNHDARYVVFLLTVLLLERTQTHHTIRNYIRDRYSRVMTVGLLNNCCILAMVWHVDESTCECKHHAKATGQAAFSAYMSI